MSAPLHDSLRRWFGHPHLHPEQDHAIRAFEAGNDVLLVLPTGGGKSLCYQLPAVRACEAGRGLTLVVSPLVALMDDQVTALRARGVRAVALHSHLTKEQRADARAAIQDGVALVYASPERLRSQPLLRQLAKAGIAYIAIDEAHCVAEWGHDFRKDYATLSALREHFDVPILAATATATPRVADEISASLRLRDPTLVRASLGRDNLTFSVDLCDGDKARVDRTAALVHGHPEVVRGDARALVYVATRKRARAVAMGLRASGVTADWYHAGRTPGARLTVIRRYDTGAAPVIVATTAFGMGMDRPDVRLVVHAEAPGSLEAYTQQAGRAGRDGAPADCVLLWSAKDTVTQHRLWGRSPRPGQEASWGALVRYAIGQTCRQRTMAEWFGEDLPPCGRCDRCTTPQEVDEARAQWLSRRKQARSTRVAKTARDEAVALDDAQRDLIVAFVDALKRPVGRRLLALGLRGSRAKAAKRRGVPNNPHFGALKAVPELAVLRAIDDLMTTGRLAPRGQKYPTVWIPNKRVRAADAPRSPRSVKSPLERSLRAFRTRTAKKRSWRPYQVFPDATLRALCERRPTTVTALANIPGIGPTRIARFGDELLQLVASAPAAD